MQYVHGISTLLVFPCGNAEIKPHKKGIKMKLHKLALTLIAVGVLTASGVASANADFTIRNKTGYVIKEIYVSPANKKNWGKDRMGDEVLGDGESRLFEFSDNASCKQDIKLVFDPSEAEVTVDNIDLCSIDKFTVKYNKSTQKVLWNAE